MKSDLTTPNTAVPQSADDVVDLSSEPTVTHPLGQASTIMPQVPSIAEAGSFGQYRPVRELGVGGMGIVYEAEDEVLRRRVALKVLRSDLPGEQKAPERFLQEAQAMASLVHDHIVPIYQVGEDRGRPFMAMQLLAGETLESRLNREKRLPVEEVARIGREIALGLAAAHDKGMIHRDIKPANVWLESQTGRVKLLDFGLALRRDNPHLTHTGFVIGTPSYMSPEQARGDTLDGRSDLFSLGTILYLMATGEKAFDGPTVMAVMRNLEMHNPSRVNVKRADVPAALSNLIMEMLSKEPKDRPASALVVAERLLRPEITRQSHLPVAPMKVAVFDPIEKAQNAMSSTRLPAVRARSGFHAADRAAPQGPQGSALRVLVLLAIAAIGFGLFWYYQVVNFGQLTIEAAPDAEVQVRQGGQIKHTSISERQFELRPGTYELVLTKPKAGFKLTRTHVDIRRDSNEIVRVIRDTKN